MSENIAKLMWNAYSIQAGGKTIDGKPLWTWNELGEDRQSCWIAAASVTADRIEKLEDELLHCFHRINALQTALRMVIDWDNTLDWEDGPAWGDLMDIARAALEGKDGT